MDMKRSMGLVTATAAAGWIGSAGADTPGQQVKQVYGPTEQEAVTAAKQAANVSDVIRAQGAPYAVYSTGNNQMVYRWGAAQKVKQAKTEKLVHNEFLVYADGNGKITDATFKVKGELVVPSKASSFLINAPF